MQELLNELLETAKTERTVMLSLKHLAVKARNYELASKLMEIETTNFPETDEIKNIKELEKKLNGVFRMVDLNPPKGCSWLIYETIKAYNECEGNFDIKMASKLIAKKQQIFDEE